MAFKQFAKKRSKQLELLLGDVPEGVRTSED